MCMIRMLSMCARHLLQALFIIVGPPSRPGQGRPADRVRALSIRSLTRALDTLRTGKCMYSHQLQARNIRVTADYLECSSKSCPDHPEICVRQRYKIECLTMSKFDVPCQSFCPSHRQHNVHDTALCCSLNSCCVMRMTAHKVGDVMACSCTIFHQRNWSRCI